MRINVPMGIIAVFFLIIIVLMSSLFATLKAESFPQISAFAPKLPEKPTLDVNVSDIPADAIYIIGAGARRSSSCNNLLAFGENDSDIINSAASKGGTVVLAGTFTITDAICLPDDTRLRGLDGNTRIKIGQGLVGAAIRNLDQKSGNAGIIVSDLIIEGNGSVDGIYFRTVEDSSITNCWVQNACHGIRSELDWNVTISNNTENSEKPHLIDNYKYYC